MADQPNRFAHMVEECGGLECIEQLQQHRNTRVYDYAVDIITNYFGEEEHMADRASGSVATPMTFGSMPMPEGGFRF